MITPKSDHKIKLRFVKKYGDADIILGFYTTEFWQRLFKKDQLLPWSLHRDYTRFLTALSAFSVGSIFRYRHGSKTTGLLLSTLTALWLVTFNSTLLPFFLKPLVFWLSPAFLWLTDQTLLDLIRVEIRSYPLYVFTLFYAASALIHVVMIYIGMGNTDSNKRGDSWLYLLLFKKTDRVTEDLVQMVLEPLIIAGCGYVSWLYKDPVFAFFLWSGAFAVFLQEYLDYAWRKKHDSPF